MPRILKLALCLFLAFALLFATDNDAEARRQRPKKGRKSGVSRDVGSVKAPKIKNSRKKQKSKRRKGRRSKAIVRSGEPIRGDGNVFIPDRELTIVSEDTSSISEGENFLVEEDTEIKVDSSWIKIAGYYAIWNTHSTNPYGLQRTEINEPVSFQLYDSANGRYTSFPLDKCKLTSKFGARWGRTHFGVDLDLDTWDTVRAAFDGIVRINGWDGRGYGNFVLLRHFNGLETLYGHMVQSAVEEGQLVSAGDIIGYGGSTGRSTGPHLHYEVRYIGHPMNPELLYDFSAGGLRGRDFVLDPSDFQFHRRVARTVSYHRVRSGETLSSIARRYRMGTSNLARLNGLGSRSKIRAGQRLRIR